MKFTIPLIGITLHLGSKDGGPESHVYMYGIECKWAASVLLLRFEDGSRDAYHSHAFNAVSAVLTGKLHEQIPLVDGTPWRSITHMAPVFVWTPRKRLHRVVSVGRTWALSLRGPWQPEWTEVRPGVEPVRLGYGRVVRGQS